jgi:hypothetical protein
MPPVVGVDAPKVTAFNVASTVGVDRPAPQISSAGVEIFPVNAPLMIALSPGKYFDAPLEGFLAGEGVESAMLTTGQALPSWMPVPCVCVG